MNFRFWGLNPFALSSILTGISSACFGLIVLWKSENRKLGKVWCLFAVSVAIWGFAGFGFSTTADYQKAFFWWHVSYALGVIWIAPSFYHFCCEFIETSVRWTRLHYGIGFIWLVILPSHLFFSRARWLFGSFYYSYMGHLFPVFFVWWGGLVCFSHYRLIVAFKEVSLKKQNQIKLFILATAVGYGGGCLSYLPDFGIDIYPWGNFAIAAYPIIMSYAILKHQLMDVNLVIRRTLVYSMVSASLGAIYVGILMFIARGLEGHVVSPSAYSAAIAAAVIALLFDPVRNRIQRFIDSRFSRFRIDREEKLMQFSNQIVEQQSLEQTTRSLCQILSESLSPKSFAIYTRFERETTFNQIYKEGDIHFPDSLPWNAGFVKDLSRLGVRESIPISSRGEALGYLLLGEKRSDLPYTDEDRVLLRLLANQAALAYERPRLLQEVSSGLVHEIKMPMANITLPAELTYMQIEEALKENGSDRELLSKIQKRMKYIMDQALLASHRVDALQQMNDSSRQDIEVINLGEVIEGSLAVVRDMAVQDGVRIEIDIPEQLPGINGNEEQLKIVFTNVFKNAIEAMKTNAAHERVLSVVAQAHENRIAIDIRDTGPGIPDVGRELIFQSRYSTKGVDGSGMGLFLTRQIIRAHGGGIILGASTDRGACFSIDLPTSADGELLL